MKTWMKALGAGLLLTVLSATGAAAQDAATQARTYLDGGLERHSALGFSADRTTPDLVQPLRIDSAFLWPVYLRSGVTYRVYGACDNDCQDMDMEIYDARGLMADRDIATDDTPYVQITPTETGRAYVRMWVYQCNAEPCYVAARVVSGGTPAEREEIEEVAGDLEGGADYESVVRSELDSAGEAHLQQGYVLFNGDVIAPIPLGDGHREVVRLEANRSYRFQGACDQDCSDVDMEILDPSGAQVAEDVAIDDRPVVSIRPTRAGDYTVRVWLAACNAEPCFVGLRGYSRAR
jgi:hypothetical protein